MSGRYNASLFWWYTKNVCALEIKAMKGKIFQQNDKREVDRNAAASDGAK